METLYTESLLKNRLVAGESYHHEENKFNALVYTENSGQNSTRQRLNQKFIMYEFVRTLNF